MKKKNTKKLQEEKEEESDSDESLAPYDLEDDESDLKSAKTPVYLQECIIGLRGGTKPNEPNVDLIEITLNVVESIIRSEPDDLHELSQSLTSILLHLNDEYNLPSFSIKRHNSLVALLVLSTKQSVPFITEEFYNKNYNIKQRIDMLCILEDASIELASGKKYNSVFNSHLNVALEEPKTSLISKPKEELKSLTVSKKIVNERIEKNTRRWHNSNNYPALKLKNNFLPFAGLFFFPLLKEFDSNSQAYYKLLQGDKMIISKLIHVLGILVENLGDFISSSEGLNMCKTLLEVLFVIRFHEESLVRYSSLFALLSKIVLNLGENFLLQEFSEELKEIQQWLILTIQQDSDENCSTMATFIFGSIQQKLQLRVK